MEAMAIEVSGRALLANSLCSTGRNARPEKQILRGNEMVVVERSE
jgi:hypothetical protein